MAHEQILTETRGRVGIVTLNRPDSLNAFTGVMQSEIQAQVQAWNADDTIGAMVLTGAGRAFSAGADVGGFEDFEHDAADLVADGVEAGALVAAHMEDGALDAERSRPLHVLLEGTGGAIEELFVLRSQIDEVDAVEEDGHRYALVLVVEGGDGLVADAGRPPLLGRRDEELDGLRADLFGATEYVLGTSRGGDVGADSHGGECTRGRGVTQV